MAGTAVAASCAFMLPFAHQCNLMVMGPGGYSTKDFARVGNGLSLVMAAGTWVTDAEVRTLRAAIAPKDEDGNRSSPAEDRTVRVVVEDGVQLGVTDDLDPSRLNVTVCSDVVVDARFDLEL